MGVLWGFINKKMVDIPKNRRIIINENVSRHVSRHIKNHISRNGMHGTNKHWFKSRYGRGNGVKMEKSKIWNVAIYDDDTNLMVNNVVLTFDKPVTSLTAFSRYENENGRIDGTCQSYACKPITEPEPEPETGEGEKNV